MTDPNAMWKDRTFVEQFRQFFHGPTWDGDLVSKEMRDILVGLGYASQTKGYNLLTEKGLEFLLEIGLVSLGESSTF